MIGINVLHTTLTLTLKLEAWSSKLWSFEAWGEFNYKSVRSWEFTYLIDFRVYIAIALWTMMQNRVPTTLTSVYRLFLRASSAAVLHHARACTNLRRRWRPAFDKAAKVAKELQQPSSDTPDNWKTEKIEWLKVWNKRSKFNFASFSLCQ